MMSNVESEKVKAMANPNPNSSPVSRRNSSKASSNPFHNLNY